MLYTGIDLHKDNCFLTTFKDDGTIVAEGRIQNKVMELTEYFQSLGSEPHRAVVEATGGWYWLDDLLTSLGIELVLAHAKYLKAIAYAKVKTDRIDSRTLAQLLRMNYIPVAHKIRRELREVRDLTRARLRFVWKRTNCYNSIHRTAEKFNCDDPIVLEEETVPDELPELYKRQLTFLYRQISLLSEQIKELEHLLNGRMLHNDDIQRLLWVPAFGLITAFSVYLEIDGIERFDSDRQFFSYARLVPGAADSNRKHRHKSGSKDSNKYLKIAFSEASVHAIRFYPEVRAFYQKMRRRSNEAIARTVVAKELARIVYHMLKNKVNYRGFKGQPIQQNKALAWPRRARFAPASAVAQS